MKKYEKYQNTAVEWLPEIPAHWDVVKLKYRLKYTTGFTPPTGDEQFYNEGITWVTIADMNKKVVCESATTLSSAAIEKYKPEITLKGSLLYSFKLSVGKVAFAGKDLYTNEAIMSILPDENIDLRYFYYTLPYQLMQNANENIYGAKILNQELIRNAFVAYPPLKEQSVIADYLDSKILQLDELVLQKLKLIELLREEHTSIINDVLTKGINCVIFENSKLEWIQEIPKGWRVSKLKFAAHMQSGYAFSSEDFLPEGIQLIKIGNLYQNEFSLDRQPTFLPEEFLEKYDPWVVKDGDILMSMTGTLGKRDYGFAIIIENTGQRFLLNQRVSKIEFDESQLLKELGLYILRSNYYQDQLFLLPTGTKQGNLSNEQVLSLPVIFPSSLEEQKEIIEYIKASSQRIDSTILTIKKEIDLLHEYRTALISEAVTGKIKVV